MRKRTVVFVCTANQCRSPMAEYMLRRELGPLSQWTVASAGTAAIPGMPASANAIDVLAELGIDAHPHRSQPVSRNLVDSAAFIFAMTEAILEQVAFSFPHAVDRIFPLKSLDDEAEVGDIADPVGSSREAYRRTREEIRAALPNLVLLLHGHDGA